MKKVIVLAVLAGLWTGAGWAQTETDDSVYSEMDKYHPELGYFQKAYSDIGDPRFMYTDHEGKLAIGIGGTINGQAFYDFEGTTNNDNPKFSTVKIPIPSDPADKFGMAVSSTELHVKARSKLGNKHQLIAYIGVTTNDENTIKLGKAYVSFDGLTIGRTYSFFMDLAANAKTVDLYGPSTQINVTQPLVGYTKPVGKHWIFAASAEKPQVSTASYPGWGLLPENQRFPDVAAKAVYRWNSGHIQVAGILRNMEYWQTGSRSATPSMDDGEDKNATGWGVALSGHFAPTRKSHIEFQSYYGKGISRYVKDLKELNIELVPSDYQPGVGMFFGMKAVPVWGGYLSGGYKWNKRLSSNFVFGYMRAEHPDDMYFYYSYAGQQAISHDFRSSAYGAINCFWAIDPYCSVGFEYVNGYRKIYPAYKQYGEAEKEAHYGEANRLNIAFIYQF